MNAFELRDFSPPGDADSGAPLPGMHQCPVTRKDGELCRRWVFNKYRTCPVHRPKLTSEQLADKECERIERQRTRLLGAIVTGQAMEAACRPDCYASADEYKKARGVRRQWVRRAELRWEKFNAEQMGDSTTSIPFLETNVNTMTASEANRKELTETAHPEVAPPFCSAVTKKGLICTKKPVAGTPFCHCHQPGYRPPNQNLRAAALRVVDAWLRRVAH